MIALNNYVEFDGESLKPASEDRLEPVEDIASKTLKDVVLELKKADGIAISNAVDELLKGVGITPPQSGDLEELERVKNALAARNLQLEIGELDIPLGKSKATRIISLVSLFTEKPVFECQTEVNWGE